MRPELNKKYPGLGNAKLSSLLGQVWKSLTAFQKEIYVHIALQEKARHKKEYPDYQFKPNIKKRKPKKDKRKKDASPPDFTFVSAFSSGFTFSDSIGTTDFALSA